MLGTPSQSVCPFYASAFASFLEIPALQPILSKEKTVLARLEKILNASNAYTQSLVAATDALVVSRCANKTLNVDDDLIEEMFQLELDVAKLLYNNRTLSKVLNSQFLLLLVSKSFSKVSMWSHFDRHGR